MSSEIEIPGPRFRVGDQVKVVGFATAYRGEVGVVSEVMLDSRVYRYRVLFTDDASCTFYGFELQTSEVDGI